jgi:putative acyl-CoA dehydrogenase
LSREPDTRDAFFAELAEGAARDTRLRGHLRELQTALATDGRDERAARSLVAAMALGLQAAVLLEGGDPQIADAFCAARLGPSRGLVYGELPTGIDNDAIVARAAPRRSATTHQA